MGGAIFTRAGTVVITNSTVTGNTASGGTAGPHANAGQGLGGGLFSYDSTLTVTNSTFAANAAGQGGGFYILGLGLAPSTAVLNNTIIANNTGMTGSDLKVATTAGGTATVSGQANLILSIATSATGMTTNLVGTLSTDPLLDPLRKNGGLTPTMAIQLGSPAKDAGIKALAPATDQRGVERDNGQIGSVDIGAYEIFDIAANMVVNTAADVISAGDGKLSLSEALALADGTLSLDALSGLERNQIEEVDGDVSTITFDSSLNGKTLTLSSVRDNRAGPSAFLIRYHVAIVGPGGVSGIVLSAAGRRCGSSTWRIPAA